MIEFSLLDLPVLFISEYINNHKQKYYKVFKEASDDGKYLEFVEYMLDAINSQAKESTDTLLGIKKLHEEAKRHIRAELPKIYSRDLIDAIFSQPLMTATRYKEIMNVAYPTAQKHLRQLEKIGFMKSAEVGKYRIYANIELMKFLNKRDQ
jgi:Fic family protein